jgi:hypothetical protein
MTVAKKFTSPALPLPAQAYDVMSENDKSRVLRLYFNLLDLYLNQLTVYNEWWWSWAWNNSSSYCRI